MCHCEDSGTCKTSLLPNRADSLYDNELDCDVVFLVGVEPDVWRIAGRKKILCDANPVFRALLEGPLASHEKTIVIEDVENRAFDYLLRYLYGKKIFFQSKATALSTLYAAHKYLCSGLVELCVKYLDENLTTKNVLEIYTHARVYADNRKDFEPSAPEASTDICDLHTPTHCYSTDIGSNNNNNYVERNDSDSLQASSIYFWSEALVYNCLQHIDENAEEVLNQEYIEEMSAADLQEIIKRDTLKVKSEFLVFLALQRWANCECKRQKLNLNSKNCRLVLGDLIYEIRFPFLSSEEFVLGPVPSGWLDQQELLIFSALISKSKNLPPIPHHWKSHMNKISKKRTYVENESVTLSQRTYLLDLEKNKQKDLKKNYFVFKNFFKNKNNKCAKDKDSRTLVKTNSEENEKSCWKCFTDFFIDILVCLFD